ncbi:MAG: ABC transporter substrate-binding protein [Lachnospiraceae bacterium]|nr:ABC transporter substrate-binding protein [Lachnospiraceae bacterium]
MRKKVLSILLALAMTVPMAVGCGNQSTEPASGDSQQTAEETASEGSAAAPEEIVVRFACLGTVPADLQQVADAINEISIPEINVKIDLESVSIANYDNQLALDMTSGEQVDLFCSMNFQSMMNAHQLMDITDYLDQYGKELVSEVSEDWLKATSVNGRIYGVPVVNGKAATTQIVMRKDILDKYDLHPEYEMAADVTDPVMTATIEDISHIFSVVKENEPEMTVLYYPVSGNGLSGIVNKDPLDDSIGVLMGTEGFEVVDLYETDEYMQMLEIVRDWYTAGYIKSDIATDTENEMSYMAAGRLFATISESEIGTDAQYKNGTGYDWTCIKIKEPYLTSQSLNMMTWAVSSTSQVPEAAVKFMNLAYTNKDVANMMCYGVKDVHWVLTEEGTVAYPEGVDASTSGYPSSTYWEMPNSLIADPLVGNTPDYNELLRQNNLTAPVSRAMGFSFDNSSVSSEIAAIYAVVDEYRAGLLGGALDLDENYPRFIQKLKDAGIDTVIAEKQKQLDAWAQENGVSE